MECCIGGLLGLTNTNLYWQLSCTVMLLLDWNAWTAATVLCALPVLWLPFLLTLWMDSFCFVDMTGSTSAALYVCHILLAINRNATGGARMQRMSCFYV